MWNARRYEVKETKLDVLRFDAISIQDLYLHGLPTVFSTMNYQVATKNKH